MEHCIYINYITYLQKQKLIAKRIR